MTRVLWVTDEPPDRSRGGGSIRQANLLQRVAAKHEVHLLTTGLTQDARTLAEVRAITRVELPTRGAPTPSTRMAELAAAAVQRRPVALTRSRTVRDALRAPLGRLAPTVDVVCVEHDWLAPLGVALEGSRTSLTLHYLPSQRARQWRDAATSPASRLRWAREARSFERAEARWVQGYDGIVVVSEEDRRDLGAGVVVPNGVDTDRIRPTPLPDEPRIVLTGSFDYEPNVDGAVWFVEHVLPHVSAVMDDARVDLVGRRPDPRLRALATDHAAVALHADVPSVLPYLASARVVVVPLRVGSGTRIKALEAMAAGRPVVGTRVGLAGLGLDDRIAVRADEPVRFAEAVVRLLRDRAAASALAAAGRAHVEDGYGWDRIGAAYAGYLEDLATTDPQAASSPSAKESRS